MESSTYKKVWYFCFVYFTEMMNIDLGFSDLNIPVSGESSGSLKELVLRAFELGYQTVALNTVVDQVHTNKILQS